MEKLILTQVTFGTPEYDAMVDLRNKVLRIPLGMEFESNDLEKEYDQFHFAVEGFFSNELYGCLILKEINKDIVKMRQVAVHPGFQGQGIGLFLVERVERWVKANHYKKIELSARDTAVSFYLKQEYHTTGEPFVEVGIPHLHMEKFI